MKKSGRILILVFALCFAVSMRTSASLAGVSPQKKAVSSAGTSPQEKPVTYGKVSFDAAGSAGAAAFTEGGALDQVLAFSESGDEGQEPGSSEGGGEDPGSSEGGEDPGSSEGGGEDPGSSEGGGEDPGSSEGSTGEDPGSSGEGSTDDEGGSGDGNTGEETVTPDEPAEEDPETPGGGGAEIGSDDGEDEDSGEEYDGVDDETDDGDDDYEAEQRTAGNQNANNTAQAQSGIVRISVVDAVSGTALEGASMSIADSNGTLVMSWESGQKEEIVRNLETGKEYILSQNHPPKGFGKVPDMGFTIDENGKVTLRSLAPASDSATTDSAATADSGAIADSAATTDSAATAGSAAAVSDVVTTTDEAGNTVLQVRNVVNLVSILTVDASDRKALEGAKLRILDKDETIVDEWVSEAAAHTVERLEAGEYTLREAETPGSYSPAADAVFTIDEYGKIVSTGPVMTNEAGRTVLLVESTAVSFLVTRVAADTGESLAGAELVLFEAEAETGENGENGETGKNDEAGGLTAAGDRGPQVDSWTSEKDGMHDFGGSMRRGVKYVLVEVSTPDGFKPMEDIPVAVEENGEIRVDLPSRQADDGKLIYLVEGARVQQPAPAPRETGNRTINRLFSLLGDYAPVKLAAIVVAVVVAVVLLIRGTMRY